MLKLASIMSYKVIVQSFLLSFILLVTKVQGISQNICIPEGIPVMVDGVNGGLEWVDADSVEIIISGSRKVSVKYKHDGSNLFFAFIKNLESAGRFPEVLIDVGNNKTQTWNQDDFWFHVSATDCSSIGEYGNYSNCSLKQPDWEGVPNTESGPPSTDFIEIKIPFGTIKLQSLSDTIGISFNVTNTATAWSFWPTTALTNSPSTWANAYFCTKTTGVLDKQNNNLPLLFYPNPVGRVLTINQRLLNSRIEIFNIQGQEVQSFVALSTELSLNELNNGIYFIKTSGGVFSRIIISN